MDSFGSKKGKNPIRRLKGNDMRGRAAAVGGVKRLVDMGGGGTTRINAEMGGQQEAQEKQTAKTQTAPKRKTKDDKTREKKVGKQKPRKQDMEGTLRGKEEEKPPIPRIQGELGKRPKLAK